MARWQEGGGGGGGKWQDDIASGDQTARTACWLGDTAGQDGTVAEWLGGRAAEWHGERLKRYKLLSMCYTM